MDRRAEAKRGQRTGKGILPKNPSDTFQSTSASFDLLEADQGIEYGADHLGHKNIESIRI